MKLKSFSRCEDMRPIGKGVLTLTEDDEGDIHLQILVDDKKNNEDFKNHHRVSIEFVAHNTQSPNTIEALKNLMKAIEKDNEEYPKKMWPQRI